MFLSYGTSLILQIIMELAPMDTLPLELPFPYTKYFITIVSANDEAVGDTIVVVVSYFYTSEPNNIRLERRVEPAHKGVLPAIADSIKHVLDSQVIFADKFSDVEDMP